MPSKQLDRDRFQNGTQGPDSPPRPGWTRWSETPAGPGRSSAGKRIGQVRPCVESTRPGESPVGPSATAAWTAGSTPPREDEAHRARLELLGRLSSESAHDLNNLLTVILGYADLLDLELDLHEGQRGHEELQEMRGAVDRATRVVDGLLRFGRKPECGVADLPVGSFLSGLTGLLQQVLGRHAELVVDADADAGSIRVDRAALESALLNLAANARAAFDGPGRFTLRVRRIRLGVSGASLLPGLADPNALAPGDYLQLTARDDGCGIDPATAAHIFEPFFTTKPAGEGTGLGLASVAECVRAAAGAVGVESEPGVGTAFHLYFPVAPDAVASSHASPVRDRPDANAPRVQR